MTRESLERAVAAELGDRRAMRERLLRIARYDAGEMDADERAAFERHLAVSPACRADLADLRSLDEPDLDDPGGSGSNGRNPNALYTDADRPPPAPTDAGYRVLRFPSRRWLPGALVATALAAGLVAWVLGGRTVEPLATGAAPPEAPGLIAKGAWSLHVGVRRGASVFQAAPGTALERGDQLGLFYSTTRPGHLMVLFVDDGQQVTRIVPAEATTSLPVEPGERLPLPDSAVLGPATGCEYLVGAFSPSPFRASDLHRLLDAHQLTDACRSGAVVRDDLEIVVHAVPR